MKKRGEKKIFAFLITLARSRRNAVHRSLVCVANEISAVLQEVQCSIDFEFKWKIEKYVLHVAIRMSSRYIARSLEMATAIAILMIKKFIAFWFFTRTPREAEFVHSLFIHFDETNFWIMCCMSVWIYRVSRLLCSWVTLTTTLH